MRILKYAPVWFIAVLATVLVGSTASLVRAQGVSVAPLRILFDGRTRSATVFLSNRSAKTSTYRISLVNRRMLETGEIVEAVEERENELFASELVRFSPRRVTIPAFSSQTIRLLIRYPRGDVPENAEYRTHMSIRSIPATPRLENLEEIERTLADGKLAVKASATVETVIPILLRLGNPRATIAIENPRLTLEGPKINSPTLTVDLLRTGERSVYGELEVIHVSPDGVETQLSYARGLAVYFPTAKRTKNIKLIKATPELLRNGQLKVRYSETEDMHGDQYAELLVPLGNGR